MNMNIPIKRGKHLMYKRPSGKTIKRLTYTRIRDEKKKPTSWCLTLRDVHTLSARVLLRRLLCIGLLFRLKTCPTCGGRIHSIYDNNLNQGRCKSWKCHRWIRWTCKNRFFFSNHGARPIKEQLGPLLAYVVGMVTNKAVLYSGYNLSAHRHHVQLLRDYLADYVEKKQEEITYGEGPDWEDVEVDEVLVNPHNLLHPFNSNNAR